MRAELIGPDDRAWTSSLAAVRHDVYHLPSYVAFAAHHQEPGEPVAFVARDHGAFLFVPMILRPLPALDGTEAAERDATSPRGYAGPIVATTDAGSDFVSRSLAALESCFRDSGIVTLFSRLHPLLHPAGEAAAAFESAGTVVDHGESVSVDLALDDDAWRRGMRMNHRRDIDRARRAGLSARIDPEWERFDGFLDAYRESMARLGAASFWHLSREYFVELREALGDRLHLCVVERGDVLAAAGLLTEVDGIVEYHLAGTLDEFVAASPSKLIVDFARGWARERGNRTLHLAGSLGTGDSLHHFKIGFSPVRHPVRSWRLIADPDRYGELVDGWVGANRRPADGPDGFFPAYRRPAE